MRTSFCREAMSSDFVRTMVLLVGKRERQDITLRGTELRQHHAYTDQGDHHDVEAAEHASRGLLRWINRVWIRRCHHAVSPKPAATGAARLQSPVFGRSGRSVPGSCRGTRPETAVPLGRREVYGQRSGPCLWC